MSVFALTPEVVGALHALELAAAMAPIDIQTVFTGCPENPLAHTAQMEAQSLRFSCPDPFCVTLTVETNHARGRVYRHLCVSREGRDELTSPAVVWTIARELGFDGEDIGSAHRIWLERFPGLNDAVHLVQQVLPR